MGKGQRVNVLRFVPPRRDPNPAGVGVAKALPESLGGGGIG